jgi:hypothetical protein
MSWLLMLQWACILFGDPVKMQHQMPLFTGICWCSFLTGVTENIIDLFSQTANQWLPWFLTTPLLSSQKLQVNLDLPVFLVPLSCWSSCNITFVFSQNAWFGKLFSQYEHSWAHLSLSGPVLTALFKLVCVFLDFVLYAWLEILKRFISCCDEAWTF